MARRYSRSPIADEAAYQKKLEVTQSFLTKDSHVLEFGCGTGSTALTHSPFVRQIRAIDFSSKMIEICEEKRTAAGICNVKFECSTLAQIDPSEAVYDVVLALSVLHLLKNWRESIRCVERLLKPGGVFVSSTACIADSMAWMKYVLPIGQAVGLLPTVVFFTKAQLQEALCSSGFRIEYQWQPGVGKAVFIVARKASNAC